jgi:hypothetical protein
MLMGMTAGPSHADEIVVEGTDTVIGLYRDELTEKIERAIVKGAVYLKNNQARDGSWSPPDEWGGAVKTRYAEFDFRAGSTAVILMGLLYCGTNVDNPTIERGLRYLAKHERRSISTYTRSAMLGAFAMSDPHGRSRDHSRMVERQAKWLLMTQQKNKHDLWRYSNHPGQLGLYDLSCTQFALEALRIADNYGQQMPPKMFLEMQKALWKLQNNDGSWAYSTDAASKGNKNHTAPRLSMTAATTAGLAFLDAYLTRAGKPTGRRDPHIDSGLSATRKMYKATVDPYEAYSIERAGILTGTRYLGDHDWYREIATKLIARQAEDGHWPSYPHHNDRAHCLGTGFTLLFLGKGLAPTVVGRLDWGVPGRATPWDMRNLTEAVSREIGSHLNWYSLPVGAKEDEYLKFPLIYIAGAEDPYDKLIRHKAKFVRYLNAGGTILGVGVENNEAFEKGFKKFVGEIQPGAAFEELDTKHPIYNSWHDIRRSYGLYATKSDKGGRPMALYIDKPFAVPLDTRRGRGVKRATELGTNIIVALTQIDKRKSLLEDAMK